ncbi:hypothetical protein [Streptomyces sp. NPDC048669]|uniref:hypothetical protein n=1 Tax=Streptomyces sp. NPDC048669 TaxID=3155267 RepID=UPI003416BEFB
MSTDYCIRLERGPERHPSEQVLRAIAGALRLNDAAAAHLFRLDLSVFGTAAAATTVAPELLRLMDGKRAVPAFVVGAAVRPVDRAPAVDAGCGLPRAHRPDGRPLRLPWGPGS